MLLQVRIRRANTGKPLLLQTTTALCKFVHLCCARTHRHLQCMTVALRCDRAHRQEVSLFRAGRASSTCRATLWKQEPVGALTGRDEFRCFTGGVSCLLGRADSAGLEELVACGCCRWSLRSLPLRGRGGLGGLGCNTGSTQLEACSCDYLDFSRC